MSTKKRDALSRRTLLIDPAESFRYGMPLREMAECCNSHA